LASFDTEGELEFAFKDDPSAQPSVRSSFGERFAFDRASAPWTLQPAQASVSFDDRFSGEGFGEGLPFSVTIRTGAALPRTTGPLLASATAPRAAARAVLAQAPPKRTQQSGLQLASASDTSLPLAYAPTDSVKGSLKNSAPKDADPLADLDPSRARNLCNPTIDGGCVRFEA
jgi:hypothetical protein